MLLYQHPPCSWSLRYQRALDHFDTFHKTFEWFRESHPCKLAVNPQSEHPGGLIYVKGIDAAPLQLSVMLGDALQNLRQSLDHIVWELSIGATDNSRTEFFISDNAKLFRTRGMGRIARVTDDAKAFIDAVQPYYRGDFTDKAHAEPLWILDRLGNVDKHRAIHLLMVKPHGTSIRFITPERVEYWDLTPPNIKLEPGAVVGAVTQEQLDAISKGEVNMNFTMELEIAFADGPAKDRLVREVWAELSAEVDAILTRLSYWLVE